MKIKHVFGNVLRIDIPLTIKIRTIEGGVPTEREEPFYPNLDMPVTVELANNYNTRVLYDATVYENVAHIEDNGLIRVGDYKVTVKCFDDSGNPYRYMVRDIVEIVDATIDADIEAGIEFDAETHTLEGAVFISYQSSGFEQVQADWEETNVNSKAYIRRKPNLTQYATKTELAVVESKIPTLPENIVTDPNYVHTDNNFSNEEKQKLSTLENYDDTGVKGLINTEKQRAEGAEEGLSASINNIGRVIPAQASAQNQLADKGYVNHSISTNTADFKGTYNSVAELSNITDATNNDYAFVIITDAQGNQFYDRYKYNGTTWLYEYRIESTAFTAQQWASIQSGITSALVAKLSDLPTNEALQEALTLINTTLSGKQDAISDLAEIRSGAAAGATAVQTETDPTVPEWAKQPSKPIYTAQEVQALPADTPLFSGSYNDLTDKPTIPDAQIQSDWNQTNTEAKDFIKNKPTIPSIPTNVSAFVNDAGYVNDISMKVDKEQGKGLSSNDYTTKEKAKLASLENYDDTAVRGLIAGKQDIINDLATIRSGAGLGATAYQKPSTGIPASDIADGVIPTVPTNVSSFTNDAGYLTAHQDISGKEDKIDIVAASGSTLTAEVGKYYTLSNVGTLAITLPTITSGTTKVQTVIFYIAAGSSPAVTFTSTHPVYYSDGFEIEADSTYEVNALWNGAAWIVASVNIIVA